MNTYIAFLRGVNVGGHSSLPMKDLRTALERRGMQNVKTYIQSGNVVFQKGSGDSRKLSHEIELVINEGFQLFPKVLVLSIEELRSGIASNPFSEGECDPTSLHFFFLKSRPIDPDMGKLDSLRSAGEKFELIGTVFYLHAPDGVGRSKLAANVEKVLGVAVTARNWRSVNAVMSIALEMVA
jgi:uncharacterized protein (DUF1697 family)